MSNLDVFFAVILIIWFGIGGYLFYLHGKVKNLTVKIDELKQERGRHEN